MRVSCTVPSVMKLPTFRVTITLQLQIDLRYPRVDTETGDLMATGFPNQFTDSVAPSHLCGKPHTREGTEGIISQFPCPW